LTRLKKDYSCTFTLPLVILACYTVNFVVIRNV